MTSTLISICNWLTFTFSKPYASKQRLSPTTIPLDVSALVLQAKLRHGRKPVRNSAFRQSSLLLLLCSAETCRFWDWLTPYDAISKTVLPPILTNAHEKIAILEPLNENQIWVQNPLLHYHFEAVTPGFGPDDTKWKMNYFASWGRTYRWPTPNNPHNPAEQYDLLNK